MKLQTPLAVTMGDPAGCGPQITVETWKRRRALDLPPFFVVGDQRLYASESPTERIASINDVSHVFDGALPVLHQPLSEFEALEVGKPSSVFASSILNSIETSTHMALSGEASAVVTNPISKSVLYQGGFAFPGHTEFIADLCANKIGAPIQPVMMLVGGGLRVALATIHIPLMKVLDHLTADLLKNIARITHQAIIEDFGVKSPSIAFTGLNPHAGEDGTIGFEERDLINPVAEALNQEGINISTARPADTVFHEALRGQYDAVIAMTHDQGLIPVKTLDMWGGVNTTLGLPIVRTSPDHGTAFEAAAETQCRPDSLISAIRLAHSISANRGGNT